MNRLGKFDLFGREVLALVVGQFVGKNEQAVERRAQLVRHVGDEFGFVLGGDRKLFCFFFERLAGLFDFAVLAFYFDVLVGQEFRLFAQLLVGLLQFLLLALQLFGQRLRLFQQVLRSSIGLDRIE